MGPSRQLAPPWPWPLPRLEDTWALGAHLAGQCRAGQLLGLVGAMGAGKTTLVQALARGLGVLDPDEVASPTYALMHAYPCAKLTLLHLDLWRLEDPERCRTLGLEEAWLAAQGVVAVEWPERAGDLWPSSAWQVALELGADGGRMAKLSGPRPPAAWPPA